MKIKRKLKVLIVDDSMFFRETLAKAISKDPAIEVVGKATDPYEARDLILQHEPDVMTLDVELPRMNGIDFLKKLMPQYPLPVIMVSSVSDSIFDALDAGAVDFVVKPNLRIGQPIDSMVNELVIKIKIASTAKVGHWKINTEHRILNSSKTDLSKIIAIGASTGGTEALASLLKALPKEMPGIVIVQHMPPVFTRMYAERLNNSCLLEVKEAAIGDEVYPGRVLIAPGEFHMVLKKKGNTYIVDCYKGEKVSGHCPSVDVLFNSVAEVARANSVGVILTGMGSDGAQGLLKMRQAGARTIGQDQDTSVVYGMPKVAYEIGAVEKQTSLAKIPNLLHNLVNEG